MPEIVENIPSDQPIFPNPSGMVPLGHNILIYPIPVERETKGGIIIPETKAGRDDYAQSEGLVIAIGPMAWADLHDGTPWASEGDRVIFSKYAGSPYMGKDGKRYRVLADQELVVRLEGHSVADQIELY